MGPILQAQGLDADELESFRSGKAGGPKAGTARTKRKKNGPSGQDSRTGNSESRIDLYKVLGLENYRYLATDSQIKKAHQAAALKWHPDKHASASPEQQVSLDEEYYWFLSSAFYACNAIRAGRLAMVLPSNPI